jgi:hypothetical protein
MAKNFVFKQQCEIKNITLDIIISTMKLLLLLAVFVVSLNIVHSLFSVTFFSFQALTLSQEMGNEEGQDPPGGQNGQGQGPGGQNGQGQGGQGQGQGQDGQNCDCSQVCRGPGGGRGGPRGPPPNGGGSGNGR